VRAQSRIEATRIRRNGRRRVSDGPRAVGATPDSLQKDCFGRRHYRRGRRPLEVARLSRQQRKLGFQRLHSSPYSSQVKLIIREHYCQFLWLDGAHAIYSQFLSKMLITQQDLEYRNINDSSVLISFLMLTRSVDHLLGYFATTLRSMLNVTPDINNMDTSV
jgi:hypothetical protein